MTTRGDDPVESKGCDTRLGVSTCDGRSLLFTDAVTEKQVNN